MHTSKFNCKTYLTVSVLGNSLKLNIKYENISSIELEKNEFEINLLLPKAYKKYKNLEVVNLSVQKLYDEIAFMEIEYSMEIARHILKFAPEDYKLQRLNNLFYKCTKDKILVINPDIVQYNKEVINTTIIKAFCQIKYRVGSNDYKELLVSAMKKYEQYKNSSCNLWSVSA